MKEYIERTTLKDRFQKRLIWLEKDVHDEYSKGLFHGCETDMGLIDEIPAADVAEVRHGRWKNGGNGLYDTCTACGEEIYLAIPMNYCPLCGARMDKEMIMKTKCEKCGRKKEIVCIVDGEPWCEECFNKANG